MASETASAVTKVLSITELLEHILLQLPCQDLLLANRICRAWRKLLNDSTQIQKALGLIPIKPNHTIVNNHLTSFRHPNLSAWRSGQVFIDSASQNNTYFFNPLIFQTIFTEIPPPITLTSATAFRLNLQYQRKELSRMSLDQMFLTQPPATEMSFGVVAEKPREACYCVDVETCTHMWRPRSTLLELGRDNIRAARGITIGDMLFGVGRFTERVSNRDRIGHVIVADLLIYPEET